MPRREFGKPLMDKPTTKPNVIIIKRNGEKMEFCDVTNVIGLHGKLWQRLILYGNDVIPTIELSKHYEP